MLRVITAGRTVLATGARKQLGFRPNPRLTRGIQIYHGRVRWNGKEYVEKGPLDRSDVVAFGALMIFGLICYRSTVKSKRIEQEQEKEGGRATEGTATKLNGRLGRSRAFPPSQ